MAGNGPAPKPNARRANAPTFDWVHLPSDGRSEPPPALPAWRAWSDQTLEEWAQWWSSPAASQWSADDRELFRMALLFDRMVAGEGSAAELTEMRQIEDRHGMSPKSRLQLRWMIADADEKQESAPTTGRRNLKVV